MKTCNKVYLIFFISLFHLTLGYDDLFAAYNITSSSSSSGSKPTCSEQDISFEFELNETKSSNEDINFTIELSEPKNKKANCTVKNGSKTVKCVYSNDDESIDKIEISDGNKLEIEGSDASEELIINNDDGKLTFNLDVKCPDPNTVDITFEDEKVEFNKQKCSSSGQIFNFELEELSKTLGCDIKNKTFKFTDPNDEAKCSGDSKDDSLKCQLVLTSKVIKEGDSFKYPKQKIYYECNGEKYRIIIDEGSILVEKNCGRDPNSTSQYVVQNNRNSGSSGLSNGGIAAICCGAGALLLGTLAGILLCNKAAPAAPAMLPQTSVPSTAPSHVFDIPRLHQVPPAQVLPPQVKPVAPIARPVQPPVQTPPIVNPVYDIPVAQPMLEVPMQPIVEVPVLQPLGEVPVMPMVEVPVAQPMVEVPVVQPMVEVPVVQPMGQPVTQSTFAQL